MKNIKLVFLLSILSINVHTMDMHTHESSSILPSERPELTPEQEIKIADELNEIKIDKELDETEPLLPKEAKKEPLPKAKQINHFIHKQLIKHLLPELSQIVVDYDYVDQIDGKYYCSQTIPNVSEILSLQENLLIIKYYNYEVLKLDKEKYIKEDTHFGYIQKNDYRHFISCLCCSCFSSIIHDLIKLKNGSFAFCLSDGTIRINSIKDNQLYTEQILNQNLRSALQNPCMCIFYFTLTSRMAHKICSHPSCPINLMQLKDGSLVHLMTKDHTIHVWKLKENKYYSHQIIDTGHTDKITKIIELEKGSLATISNDRTVKIWELKNGEYCYSQTLDHEDLQILQLIELKNGSLASCSLGNTIKIWTLKDGKYYCSQIIDAHENRTAKIIETDDGTLISGSLNEIKVWKLKENKYYCYQIINNDMDWVSGMVLLQDNSLLTFSEYLKCGGTPNHTKIGIWKLDKNGQYYLFQLLEGHMKCIKSVIQLENGSLASISADNQLKIWHNKLSSMQIPEE